MGDTNSQTVQEISDIVIKMYGNIVRKIKNVRHVPNLKMNLISFGILKDEGYTFKFNNNILKVIKGSLVQKEPRIMGCIILWGKS